jgi:hypothetical protein
MVSRTISIDSYAKCTESVLAACVAWVLTDTGTYVVSHLSIPFIFNDSYSHVLA